MRKVCKLVRLEYMQIFPAGRQNLTSRSGCGGGGVGVGVWVGTLLHYALFLVGVSSVTQEPLTTPCSAALLPP